jgi:acyl-CoA dehydrogenase
MVLFGTDKPIEERTKKTDGLSTFIVDLRDAQAQGLTIKPLTQ